MFLPSPPRLLFGLLALLASGCQRDVEVRLVLPEGNTGGLSRQDVILEARDLGRPPLALLERRARAGDIDGERLLDDSACDGPCRALEVTLFVTNRGAVSAAPPVVRLSSPPGRPARPPVALTAHEISKGRAGRIRFLLSLWPEEQRVEVRPSPSAFIEVRGSTARGGASGEGGEEGAATTTTAHDATRKE